MTTANVSDQARERLQEELDVLRAQRAALTDGLDDVDSAGDAMDGAETLRRHDETAMLDGAPPAEAVPLQVTGVSPDDVRAWRLGDKVYLRTPYTLLSPEWVASERGQGGVTIYALPSTPVVLLSTQGRSVAARLAEQ